jgi:hypothetical protein
LALTGGELAPSLRHGRRHTFSPSLGQSATQDRHQLGLCVRVKLLGRVEDVGENDRPAHSDLPTGVNHLKLLGADLAGKWFSEKRTGSATAAGVRCVAR